MPKSIDTRWWRAIALVAIAPLLTPPAVGVEPVTNEPQGKIVVDAPLAAPLSRGTVVVRYRTENLFLVPVFGPAALHISPRVGHLHVSIDDAAWVWMDASGDPLVIDGLPPGRHKILLRLQTANHQLLDEGAVSFTIPAVVSTGASGDVPAPATVQPPAKIIVDSPLAEPLSRGVVFIRYRTENLQLAPVFGPAAVAVSPRVGHVHVTVDDVTWHWTDASGGPVIINGLRPGRHNIRVQLVNANHKPLDDAVVQVDVPPLTH